MFLVQTRHANRCFVIILLKNIVVYVRRNRLYTEKTVKTRNKNIGSPFRSLPLQYNTLWTFFEIINILSFLIIHWKLCHSTFHLRLTFNSIDIFRLEHLFFRTRHNVRYKVKYADKAKTTLTVSNATAIRLKCNKACTYLFSKIESTRSIWMFPITTECFSKNGVVRLFKPFRLFVQSRQIPLHNTFHSRKGIIF